jgi:hypothetical protein
MRSVTYSMGVSLDGYIVGPDGGFDWTAPNTIRGRANSLAALLARPSAAQQDQRAPAHGIDAGYLAKVLRAFGGRDDLQGAGRGAAVAVPSLVEQLTAR